MDKDVKPGPEATYKNSLIITFLILKNLFGFNSERAFLRYLGKHHTVLFSAIPEQFWFNRKAKKLIQKEKMIHKLLLQKLGAKSIKIRIEGGVLTNRRRSFQTHLMLFLFRFANYLSNQP